MPSTKLGPIAQHFKQCQACYKEEPEVRLRSCAKCRSSHYCSRECQVANWPTHKKRCKLNQEMKAKMKDDEFNLQMEDQSSACATGSPETISLNIRETERKLKKWIQTYRPILQYSVIHALTLQSTPDLCTTHLLAITLKPNPSPKPANSIPTAFLVQTAITSPISDLRTTKNESQLDIILPSIELESSAIRAKGGVGVAIIAIAIPAARLSHITPFKIPFKMTEAEIPWNYEWETSLRETIAKGIVV